MQKKLAVVFIILLCFLFNKSVFADDLSDKLKQNQDQQATLLKQLADTKNQEKSCGCRQGC